MQDITDDYMRAALAKAHDYTVVILKEGPNYHQENARAIIWEHGRNNFKLRAAGKLVIVCPIFDASPVAGIGVFVTDIEETERLYKEDPAVKAGVLVYEVHPSKSFAGDRLPE